MSLINLLVQSGHILMQSIKIMPTYPNCHSIENNQQMIIEI